MANLKEINDFLKFNIHHGEVAYEVVDRSTFPDFDRLLIRYQGSENDEIPAYLFLPTGKPAIGSVLVHHQHAGQRHLGKSEVAGLAGDPNQWFAPALARAGIIALAPDSICFEDRRKNRQGLEADEDADWLQHYNEMCYRLVTGRSLMTKVVEDSSIGISLLQQLPEGTGNRIGILGHSYGGNTVIFHSPFDDRIAFSCSSGAVCSYHTKMEHNTGIEMAEVIPGFAARFDISDLLREISPRKLLVVSAEEDKYSRDARLICRQIEAKFPSTSLSHMEFSGGHALTEKRFKSIVDWFVKAYLSKN